MSRFSNYLSLLKPARGAVWSIGVYAGAHPCELEPMPAFKGQPALTGRGLRTINALGVADPFMIRSEGQWFMFFEVENRISGKGEIGFAHSRDCLTWEFDGIALDEPFHLSYPHVLEFEGHHYMVPETGAAGSIRLYQAEPFPMRWKLKAELIQGDFADATPLFHNNHWWLFALHDFSHKHELMLFEAGHLDGPWRSHPSNPILGNTRNGSRPAGRIIRHHDTLIRVAQDCSEYYGRGIRAFQIEELTTERYREHPLGDGLMLGPSGSVWNATGMHHADAHEIAPDQWVACVDGRRTCWRLPLIDRIAARMGRRARTMRVARG